MENKELTFDKLVDSIRQIHKQFVSQAGRTDNISLTLRNLMFGLYIAEFELCGNDRAAYGDKLLHQLLKELRNHKVSNTGRRQLYIYLAFYRAYPQIVQTVSAQSKHLTQLFVSKYQLELPKKEEMERFLVDQIKEVWCGE